MKPHMHLRAKGTARVNTQQAIFELKHRVILALNKLADRDTYQIGVEELEKTVEGLTPDGVAPFLSCIIETDSGQKSSVRKECIRIMGTLARFHEGLLGPHLGKMMGSIVKRLKDSDSVVRDACVEVVGILASKMSDCRDESEGVFVVLVKPLFEALAEQNRQVQSGSALCLASVTDNAKNPPVSIMLRMLTRIIKFLKNPHFMAKPAVIELIRSIVQAGGAPTQNALSSALTNIQEALKSSDWTTRKAASVALAGIALSGGTLLRSFKASCIRSLESCRFDKVKPVRDSVLQALQYWKSLPGSDSPEPSEAGSSTKENLCGGDYSDLTSASDGGLKDAAFRRIVNCSMKQRIPLTARKTCPNHTQNPQNSKANDWHIEIAVPKAHTVSLADTQNDESEGSCFTKTFERTNADATSVQNIEYDYVPMDDNPECSSVSNLVSSNFETKRVTDAHDCLEKVVLMSPMGKNHRSASEEVDRERQICSKRLQERQSLDSTVTEVSLQSRHGCCSQTANAMTLIQKQLLEIENKQSNLMDLVQVFMGSTMDSLTMLQAKVLGLEHAVEKIAQDISQGSNCSNMGSFKHLKNNPSVSSPRPSTCTPRPSVSINNRQSSLFPMKNREIWEDTAFSKSRSSTSDRQGVDMWRDCALNTSRNRTVKGMQQSLGCGPQNMASQSRKAEDVISASTCNAIARKSISESKNSLWKRVKESLCMGDLDSAFVEVLCSGDDLILIELLDRTGPVLERLSHGTVGEILSTLAVHFLDQRFLGSIIPWLQQVVDLSITYGPDYLALSAKARREFLSAILEAAAMDFPNPADRKSVTQLALKLRQVWGKSSLQRSTGPTAEDQQILNRNSHVQC